MRKAGSVVGTVLGLLVAAYLIVRAVVELFVVDFSDPASYRDDWGGPSLAGVLAVHSGPGLLAAVVIVIVLVRRSRAKAARS